MSEIRDISSGTVADLVNWLRRYEWGTDEERLERFEEGFKKAKFVVVGGITNAYWVVTRPV